MHGELVQDSVHRIYKTRLGLCGERPQFCELNGFFVFFPTFISQYIIVRKELWEV